MRLKLFVGWLLLIMCMEEYECPSGEICYRVVEKEVDGQKALYLC